MTAARPKLQVAAKYALAELTPPKVSDIPAIRQGKKTRHHSVHKIQPHLNIFENLKSPIMKISAGIGKLLSGAKTGAWKKLPVREAWLNTLVTIEVICWFFIGECIGKRHYVGYDV